MARPKRPIEEHLIEMPCKLPPQSAAEIELLCIQLERSKSFMARKFVLRGLAAFKRDGLLDEPQETPKLARKPGRAA